MRFSGSLSWSKSSYSGKSSGFVFGADIDEFGSIRSAEEGTRLAATGQAIISKVAELLIPTVAAIDGFTLGGGNLLLENQLLNDLITKGRKPHSLGPR